MQAVILAAGMGKRLGALTQNNTKCMVKVNGVTLIERLLTQLSSIKSCKLSRIVIVIGYEGEKLRDYVSSLSIDIPIEYVCNPIYDSTNNIYSLWLAKDYLLNDDSLLIESDLIFEDSILEKLLEDPYPSLCLVAKYESWMDGTVVKLSKDCEIEKFIPGTDFRYEEAASYYKTVNVYKFSREFSCSHYVPFLDAYCKALGNNEYYEQVLRVITLLDKPEIKALSLTDENWYEIDDIQDLDIAESIFCPVSDRLQSLEHRKGGFWRYPKIRDFTAPTNPCFPNERLLSELKANFERLLCAEPTTADISCLLVGKCYGVPQEQICVGNGTSEIYGHLVASLGGTLGVAATAVPEYLGRTAESIICYEPQSGVDGIGFTDELIHYFSDKEISALFVQNPDGDSGRYVSDEQMVQLCEWAQMKNIRLVVDESYMDLVTSHQLRSFLEGETLRTFPCLTIVKSLSEVYGVPGLRIGAMISSDLDWVQKIRSKLPEKVLNSFAEFYLQIFGKYEKIYRRACERYMDEYERVVRFLEERVKILRVVSHSGVVIVCDVLPPFSSDGLAEELLAKYNILVKRTGSGASSDHSNRISIYIRQNQYNNELLMALCSICDNYSA